jgi:plastocyanin
MGRRLALPVLVPLLLLLFAWAAAPLAVRAGDPCFHSTDRPAVTDEAATDVRIGDCTFFPTIARVPVGATVTFTNTSVSPHEVAGANLTWGAAQSAIPNGRMLSHTFAAAGVYPYSCMIHPGMTGAIVVGDGATAAAGLVAPAGPDASAAAALSSPEPVPAASSGDPLPIVAGLALAGLGAAALVGAVVRVGRRRREAVAG